ncbi:MAG: hypothetical protein O8C58_05450 [Candidatus Methanoperedens sp.]|nr:hypothetical protein [Candidatus Methanoperedens sp.]
MRIRDIVVIFLSLFIMLAGLAIPLWWAIAMPVVRQLPEHLAQISSSLGNLINLVITSLKG